MEKTKKYFLGLDIGTDSVGYALSNVQYELLKFKGEPMWGVHLFDTAMLNDERRAFRSARRRLDRRQQRVKMVQEIFATEIAKVDANFYRRMKESSLRRDDARETHTLFCDEEYTDKEYHRQYPTIHHLISELIHDRTPHDVRLVYLACAWIVAHRGHFLSEVDKDNLDELLDIKARYQSLMSFFDVAPWNCDAEVFGNILKKKNGVNAKYREFCNLIFSSAKAPKVQPSEDAPFYSIELILKLLCGAKVAPKDLFGNSDYAEVASFSLGKPDDELAELFAELGDDAELVRLLKSLYDWSILADILSGTKYISDKKVDVYNAHKADLKLLKYLVKKYNADKYEQCFRDSKYGYALYSKSGNVEEFSKYVKALFKGINVETADEKEFADMLSRLETNAFCPKQVYTDNRVIPYQVYWIELKRILENASGYLPFLNESDEDGYVNKDKLLSIMTFRVPYYVGPLNAASKYAWLKRKSEGKIYPWNFEEKVDVLASEQEFINRMTNTCTYLPYADVMPKCALLHERFQVLNEINTLSVNGERIPVDVKQKLYLECFMKRKKVTRKAIKDFLLANGFYTKDDLETLAGIDDAIKSSLSSHIAFKKMLGSGKITADDAERIICRRTCTEDKSRFTSWINETYPHLSEEDRRYISNLRFKDFARLSRELLCDLYGTETSSKTGEASSIIDKMWNENLNLMEILSERYTYRRQIEAINGEYYQANPKSIDERMREMCISNAVKRPILRALDIVSDVVKAMGCAPQKIFVEMARGGMPDEKGKRTKSRYQKLKELYSKCELDDAREMESLLDAMGDDRERKLQGEKLFLYYLQLGRSMYSGARIDIEHLSDKTYDIDHIYPQSKVKDDSVLNNKVLVLSEENGLKGDKYPIAADVRRKMAAWWKLLLDNELITPEKYGRLTRHTPFDENEEWGFINRQLVETRQSTKAVAAFLKERYPSSEIVYVKAGMVSEFRQEFDLLKSRTVNDLHHAKDAYLNIVVGNVYNERFTRKWFLENREKYNLKISTLFSRQVIVGDRLVWDGSASVGRVKKVIQNKNAIHLTRYTFCRKGGFYDQKPVKAAEGLVPLKKGLPTEKYGGYNKPSAAFFVLTKYSSGNKTELMLIPVEVLNAREFAENELFAVRYATQAIEKIIGKSVDSVELPLGMRQIKINPIFDFDGMRMCLAGKANGGRSIIVSMIMPLLLDYKWQVYIKAIDRFVNNKKEHPAMKYSQPFDKISKEENCDLFDILTLKMGNATYVKRPNNPVNTLIKGRDAFVALDIYEQCKCLLQIIAVFSRASGGCHLESIGGKPKAGATTLSSALSNWKKNYSVVQIVDQTASGLYESRSCNLLELL